jgi:restriction system protein
MSVPDFQTLMLPLLESLVPGEKTTRQVIDALADRFKLSTEDRDQLLPSGRQRTFDNRIGWAASHLRKAGLIENNGWARYRLTATGLQVLQTHPDRVDMKHLDQCPGYKEWRSGSQKPSPGAPTPKLPEVELTPEELIEATDRQLRSALEQEVLDRVHEVTPSFFEKLVVDLVVAMGYGGSREEAGRAVGQTGDEGIDGVVNEDRLGLDVIYLQAKRWAGSVGRPTVQMFAGSLEGKRASKGILLTTSTFTPEARQYVMTIGKTIILIDGPMLAKLMIEHGVGVRDTARYVVRQIDSDYFEAGGLSSSTSEGEL